MIYWKIIILAIAISPQLFAFDQERCSELFPKAGETHRPYLSPVYSSTMVPSITSYVSSFGKCAMYSSLIRRQEFIGATYPQLSFEAAQGWGEHVLALAELSGCSTSATDTFSLRLQSKYTDMFSQYKGPADLAERIDQLIAADNQLSQQCKTIN